MATTDETLANAVSTFEEMLFNKLDRLHSHGIDDNEVIRFLRAEGHTVLATRYIEWSGALDPDAEDDNTTMNPVVPDPADADGNRHLAERDREERILDAIVNQLEAEKERELYFNPDYDDNDAMLDGPVNLRELAKAVAAVTK